MYVLYDSTRVALRAFFLPPSAAAALTVFAVFLEGAAFAILSSLTSEQEFARCGWFGAGFRALVGCTHDTSFLLENRGWQFFLWDRYKLDDLRQDSTQHNTQLSRSQFVSTTLLFKQTTKNVGQGQGWQG
jgi:hypothetical protein